VQLRPVMSPPHG